MRFGTLQLSREYKFGIAGISEEIALRIQNEIQTDETEIRWIKLAKRYGTSVHNSDSQIAQIDEDCLRTLFGNGR